LLRQINSLDLELLRSLHARKDGGPHPRDRAHGGGR
jgi:hypothetical protein